MELGNRSIGFGGEPGHADGDITCSFAWEGEGLVHRVGALDRRDLWICLGRLWLVFRCFQCGIQRFFGLNRVAALLD
jgi:hypothetical protein